MMHVSRDTLAGKFPASAFRIYQGYIFRSLLRLTGSRGRLRSGVLVSLAWGGFAVEFHWLPRLRMARRLIRC